MRPRGENRRGPLLPHEFPVPAEAQAVADRMAVLLLRISSGVPPQEFGATMNDGRTSLHFVAHVVHFCVISAVCASALPALGQTVLFSDSFSRTTGLGANWYVPYGSFTTNGTYAVSGTPAINGNWAAVVPALGADDYSVQADIIVPSGSTGSGLVARSNDGSNFDSTLYALELNTDGTVALFRRNGWMWTELASAQAGITAGIS